MLLQAFEEGEELVVGSIATGLSVERSNRVENPLLQLKVGIQIDLGSFGGAGNARCTCRRGRPAPPALREPTVKLHQTSTCSAIASASSTSMPRYDLSGRPPRQLPGNLLGSVFRPA